jgi:WD40 repeat protein
LILACPGMQQGCAQVLFYLSQCFPQHEAGRVPLVLSHETTTSVDAHERPLAAMAMNSEGTLLATCSEKGTTVHVYIAKSGVRVHSLRRGVDQAEIHSLVFSPAGNRLAVAADKGTIHIFVVCQSCDEGSSASEERPENRKSKLSKLAGLLPSYFSSEWSFAQFRVPDNRFIAGFGTDETTLVVVSATGTYYKAQYDPATGGEMELVCRLSLDSAPVGSPAGSKCHPMGASRTSSKCAPMGDSTSPLSAGFHIVGSSVSNCGA